MSRITRPGVRTERPKGSHAGENGILEMMALGAPLVDVLDQLMRLTEARSEGLLASVLLLDPEGKRLRHAAAPSLPAAYMRAIDGTPIGPSVGSCGTAAYRKKMVVVTDIQTDPLWAPYKYLAGPYE